MGFSHRRRRHRPFVSGLVVGLWIAPVAAAQVELTAERVAEKRAALERHCPDLDPESPIARVLVEEPVIDTHAHTFNLAHLPLEGLLYKYPLSPVVAKPLAELIDLVVDTGDLYGAPDDQSRPREAARPPSAEQRQRERELLEQVAARKDKIYDALGIDPSLDRLRYRTPPASEQEAGRRVVEEVARAVFDDGHGRASPPTPIPDTRRDWFSFLRAPLEREDEMAAALMRDHPLVDVFVHHMMDLDRVYAGWARLDPDQRLQRMAQLDAMFRDPQAPGVSRPQTRFTVAFDPFSGPAGLAQVRRGLALGAVAVKFYPPSGYRPTQNVVPPKPGYVSGSFPFLEMPRRRYHQRRQWEARYRTGRTNTGPQLDAAVLKMFRLAHGKKVPVFSHHTPVGFEAFKGYGRLMSEPCLWQEIIESIDASGSFRLVLGHAGGGAAWFGEEPWEGSFDQQAYNLCVYYPNVYCDFGYFSEALTPEGQAALALKLAELIEERKQDPSESSRRWDPEGACETRQNAPPRFPIEDKILYGSDWFLIVREQGQQKMVCDFARTLAEPALADHDPAEIAKGFFSRNALEAFPALRRPISP